MTAGHADVSKHIKSYVAVFIALAILTVATVAVSTVDLGGHMNIIVALAIAGFKATLVATIFMHLKWERSGNIWFVLVLAAFFFTLLLLMPTLFSLDTPGGLHHGMWSNQ